MEGSLEDFRAWVKTLLPIPEPASTDVTWMDESRLYWYDPSPPFNDFNREFLYPDSDRLDEVDRAKILRDYPDGCFQIRADENFWCIANIPIRFRNLTMQEIVSVLWPNIPNPVYHNDADDHAYWEKWFEAYHEACRRLDAMDKQESA